jgi:cell division protein FtsB
MSVDRDTKKDEKKERVSRTARMRRKHPRRILSLWARLALLSIFIVLLITGAVGLIAKAVRPYREVGVQTRELAVTNQQIAELTIQNTELKRRADYLQTHEGEMAEARKLGYLRKGEVPIVVEGAPSPWAEPIQVAKPSAEPNLGERIGNFWRSIFSRH